jgi:hypothetical protein
MPKSRVTDKAIRVNIMMTKVEKKINVIVKYLLSFALYFGIWCRSNDLLTVVLQYLIIIWLGVDATTEFL